MLKRHLKILSSEDETPLQRIRSAGYAHKLCIESSQYSRAFEVLSYAIQTVLPLLNHRCMPMCDRVHMIQQVFIVAEDIACLALGIGKPVIEAISWLEQARGTIIGDLVDLRGNLPDILEQYDHNLATELRVINGEIRNLQVWKGKNRALPTLIPKSEVLHHLYGKRDQLIDQVTKLWGRELSHLLLQPNSSGETMKETMKEAAKMGPIVIFVAGKPQSHAILIKESGVDSIHLPKLHREDIRKNATQLLSLASSGPQKANSSNKEYKRILKWLWETAVFPVLEALEIKNFSESCGSVATPPRIWWIGCGLMGNFPFHAAGVYKIKPFTAKTESAMNYCISSYSLTVKTLLHSRQAQHPPSKYTKILSVIMPNTPDPKVAALPGAEVEASRLSDYFEKRRRQKNKFVGRTVYESMAQPSASSVLSGIRMADIVHFACHGISMHHSPLASHLLLMNKSKDATEKLTVERIMQCGVPSSKLAYLSACSTACLTSGLPDEGIHIASAFQLAGFQHAIGSLWETNDEMSTDVAVTFYERLFSAQNALDNWNIAASLHTTIRDKLLSDSMLVRAPMLWASYVHFGG
ncbi:CHAT domain-containing protein [Peziza echinospora]|nr:CHAT domain-containing protein [Peziza echinospora]